jgi:hypothetical protein
MKISVQPDIPVPVLLNCWKHHLGFIKKQINSIDSAEINYLDEIQNHLLKIGESQMDIYLGNLSPVEIADRVIKKVFNSGIFLINDYKAWISNDGKDYKLITLIDNSIWTLRIGVDKERYIHIHPARKSYNTIRVRATTLKSAILVFVWIKINGGSINDIKLINNVRKIYLSEPPIKNISGNKGLDRLFSIFEGKKLT